MTLSSVDDLLLLVHTATTLFMLGVIWFVQIVHYPLFSDVGASEFAGYERQHTRRTGRVVALPMLAEMASAVTLAFRMGGALAWCGLALLVTIWVSTGFWQVPAHRRLEGRFDVATHRRLVHTNWVRTVAWSARAVISIALLA